MPNTIAWTAEYAPKRIRDDRHDHVLRVAIGAAAGGFASAR
jgi:hypothetical protein